MAAGKNKHKPGMSAARLPDGRGAPPERVAMAQMLIGQMRWSEAVKMLMEHFKIKRTPATRAIAVARLLFAQQEEEQRPGAKAIALERLERIADAAEAKGQYGPAVRAWREICRIRGLYAPIEVEQSTDFTRRLRAMTDEEVRAMAKMDEVEIETPAATPSGSVN
jgi:hypothetical protein